MSEREYYLGFSVFPGIGPLRFKLLMKRFGSAKEAWSAKKIELEEVIGRVLTEKFIIFRSTFSIDAYLEKLEKKQVEFVTFADENYPQLLKRIVNSPYLLYLRGNHSLLNTHPTIGIVGTRKITIYGKQVTELFTQQLVSRGFIIVSGLAMGVDACTHKTTLDNHGKTIAVLGCGVDCCSPKENSLLYERIIREGGLIVSEFSLSIQPSVGSFPSRNRIIAGLSEGILVTEGAEDSGALITADDAAQLQIPVFAVPGQITSSLAKGPLKLLRKGARMATTVEDIIAVVGLNGGVKRGIGEIGDRGVKGDTDEEQKIIDILASESRRIDELINLTNINVREIGTILSIMELKGFIKLQDGNYLLSYSLE